MKQEATKKSKLWLWLLIGAVALLAVAGIVVALIFGFGSNQESSGGRPELYWNVDRVAYTENSTTGLSTREPAEDGLYHIRFAINGELVELTVADKPLVNYIDTMDAMGLVQDADGVIVDVVDAKDIATELTKNAYVKSTTSDMIVANSSIAMNGMKIDVKLTELTEIYDVTPQAEVPGAIITIADLAPMDTLTVYTNDLDEVTHVYVTAHPRQSKVYWRAKQMYNSTEKETTREPDENGVYTVPFFCEGELVELKTKDKTIVTKIDSVSRYRCHFGFEFDEEGYIVEYFSSALGISAVLTCECWDVVSIEGDYVTINRLINNDGSTWSGTVSADCVVYDVSPAAASEGRQGKQVEGLQVGDRVCVWSDTNGNPILAYVSMRMVDSPAYWIPTLKYSSAKAETTREIGSSGYYEVELLKEGSNHTEVYYVKDKETMSYLDSQTSKCVGLKVGSNNIIEYVYDSECLTGYVGAAKGGVVTSVTGSVFTKIAYGKRGTDVNLVLAPGARVYNVSAYGQLGAETTIMPGDHIYAYCQPTGEILLAFITKRTIGGEHLYYNLERLYDSTNKVTKREPDEEGWYVFTFAYNGKQVTLKTKSQELATKIDSQSPGAVALEVSGDIILNAYDPGYAYGGNKVASGYRYRYVTSEGMYHCTYSTDASKTVEFKMAEDCIIYNVSTVFTEFQGERIYSLKDNDMLTVYCNIYGEAEVIYVRQRDVDYMYWKVDKFYDSTNKVTTRVPDADGYYWYDLAVNGEVKTFKTKDQKVANSMDSYDGAFGLNIKGENEIIGFVSTSYVKGVKGNSTNAAGESIIGYTVSKIEGNTVSLVYNKAGSSFGKTATIKINSKTKVYDVSPSAEKFGAEVELKVGDTLRSYRSRDDVTDSYIYVQFHATREGGEYGWCEVCQKDVQWYPWTGGSVPAVDGAHVYLNADAVGYAQTTLDSSKKDYTVCIDLNGKVLTRQAPGRAFRVSNGEVMNIIDSVGGGKIVTNGGAGFSGGVATISSGGKLNLYGGTLEFVQGEFKNGQGGVIYITDPGSQFNLYSGTVTGGVSYAKNAKTTGQGGNIYAANKAEVNIYGGVISNGKSYGMLIETEKDGKITYSTVSPAGGNIWASESSVVNIYGGVIENGEAVRETYEYVVDGETKTISNMSYGGNIYKNKGNVNSGGVVYIGKATVTGGVAHRGGNIYGYIGSTFTFDGATITGGKASQFGGNIMSIGGNWIIKNGSKIADGETGYGGNIFSQGGEYTLTNATISGGKATQGGNIYLYKNKTDSNIFTVQEGAVIEGGVSKNDGGNIYLQNKTYDDADGNPMLPTLNVEGGKIINGVCGEKSYFGGNIYCAGHMNITGGEISGGLQGTVDYDIYIPGNKNQVVTISGGIVAGKLRCNGPKSLTISGAPKLGQLNLLGNKITVGEMTQDAEIFVVSNRPVFSEPFEKAEEYALAGYFKPYDPELSITATAIDELQITVPSKMAWCDHCNSDVIWYKWDFESGAYLKTEDGHYYLDEDQQISSNYRIGGSSKDTVEQARDVVLDLNGHNITSTGNVFYVYPYSTLTLKDSVGTSVVTGKGVLRSSKPGNGGLFYVEKGNLNIYGGTYTLEQTDKVQNGGVIHTGGTTKIYGGTFNGNTINGSGDTIYSTVALEIYGGTFNGEVSYKGNLTLGGNPVIGVVENLGTKMITLGDLESGADITVAGTGVFTNSSNRAQEYRDAGYFKAENGDEIVVTTDSELAISAGVQVAPNDVYAAAIDLEQVLTGGTVNARCPVCNAKVDWEPLPVRTAKVSYGDGNHHHFYLDPNVDYTANNGLYTITEGTKVCVSLNNQNITSTDRVFYVEKSGTVLNIMGRGVVTGAHKSYNSTNHNISGSTLDLCGETNLYGGTYTSTNAEAPVVAARGISAYTVVSMYEGTVIDRSSGVAGLNLYVADSGTFNMYGGTITGGTAIAHPNVEADVKHGGNVLIKANTNNKAYNATMNVYGGTISNGTAEGKGGNIYVFGTDAANPTATLNITGGTITGGTVYATGAKAAVNLSGNPVISDLDLTNGFKVGVGTMSTGANVTVDAADVFSSGATDAANAAGFFHTEQDGKKVGVSGGELAIVDDSDPNEIAEKAAQMDFTTTDPDGKVTAECPVCGGAAVEWLPLPSLADGSSFERNDGNHYHFYLKQGETYNNANHYGVGGTSTMCVNLNGCTLTSTVRAFVVDGKTATMNIMGEGLVQAAGLLPNPGVPNRGVLDTTGALNLYGGTYESTDATAPVLAIRGSNEMCVVNMYEGTNLRRTSEGTAGLIVYIMDNGELNVHGGTISGGDTTADDGLLGGNIWIKANANNNAYSATLNVYGGTITGGKDAKGGNIYVQGNDMTAPTATVNIMGGTISDGGVYATGNNASINLSGNPVVDYLDMEDAQLVNVDALEQGAAITVAAANGTVFTNAIAANAEAYAEYFLVDDVYAGVVVENNALVVDKICPHCGVAYDQINWQLLTLTSGMKPEGSGHFYLDADYTGFKSQIQFKGVGDDVVLDLRGKSITTSGRGFYVGADGEIGVTLSLLDTVGTSVVETTYAAGGGVLYVITSANKTTNVLNVYGGTYRNVGNPTNGGCVYNYRSEVNIYGGTFTEGQANGSGDTFYVESRTSEGYVGKLDIRGGNITGQILVKAGAEVSVSGAPVVTNLELESGVILDLGELAKGASITVKADGKFAEGQKAQEYLQAGYVTAIAGKKITANGNELTMADE